MTITVLQRHILDQKRICPRRARVMTLVLSKLSRIPSRVAVRSQRIGILHLATLDLTKMLRLIATTAARSRIQREQVTLQSPVKRRAFYCPMDG
ncbi:hypothetical protein AO239_27770 [Pseudomonas sp. ICMP 19500]|nr:hypothetical protein AO239_27770 [Pseudomonas sp. ICMP 19500]